MDYQNLTIYIISTPIGNLDDITKRAVDALSCVDTLVCEDTRRAGMLLQKLKIPNKPKLIALNSFNENNVTDILNALDRVGQGGGQKIGLISNAGTPLIADPGYKLIRMLKDSGATVVPIPGANAITSALIASGFPTDKFTFLGFLPKKENALVKLLKDCADSPIMSTYIAFESPYRLVKAINTINATLGNVDLCIANDITKMYESIETKKTQEWLNHFKTSKPKGEYTLVFRPQS